MIKEPTTTVEPAGVIKELTTTVEPPPLPAGVIKEPTLPAGIPLVVLVVGNQHKNTPANHVNVAVESYWSTSNIRLVLTALITRSEFHAGEMGSFVLHAC